MKLNVSIDKLKSGDEVEFKRLYQLYFPHFLSFAFSYIKDKEVCSDLVQDVFISYWEKSTDFSDIISLKVFFYRSIRNKCLNEIRDKQSKYFIEIEELHELSSKDHLEEHIIREELAVIVRQEIAKLTPQEQKILRLSLTGKTNQEIADLLSISINTVKTHKLKAYSTLRIQLQDIYSLLFLITFL